MLYISRDDFSEPKFWDMSFSFRKRERLYVFPEVFARKNRESNSGAHAPNVWTQERVL
jgi:hypothetical protein